MNQDIVCPEESAQFKIPTREAGRVVGLSSFLDGDTTRGRLEEAGVGHMVSGTTAAPGIFNEAVRNLTGE